jgi:presenilin-like A22 family membrane protease
MSTVLIQHPNREKSESKGTRAIVTLLLLLCVALMLIVMLGGWKLLVGMQSIAIFYVLIYMLFAYYVARWNRGVLPVIAALAVIMAIFCAVAAPEWFSRDNTGFNEAALSNAALGLVASILIPVQLLLGVAAMIGFRQHWNVEVEHIVEEQPAAA